MNTDTLDQADIHQRYLSAAVSLVRVKLEHSIARMQGEPCPESILHEEQQKLDEMAENLSVPSPLTRLCTLFRLSPFERDVLLLCAGMELDNRFAALLVQASGGEYKGGVYPTFSLALAALPHAHWDALAPTAPLRYWQLVTVGAGSALTLSPLRIDERILHYLTGVQYLDERLASLMTPLDTSVLPLFSHQALVEQLVMAWAPYSAAVLAGEKKHPLPYIQLCGADRGARRAIAVSGCAALGWRVSRLSAATLPASGQEMRALSRLWERESALSGTALFLDCDEIEADDVLTRGVLARFIEQIDTPLLISNRERRRIPAKKNRPVITLDVHRPDSSEQRALWQSALKGIDLNGQLDTLVSQFHLDASTIYAASSHALRIQQEERRMPTSLGGGGAAVQHEALGRLLWDTCRIHARLEMDGLAQQIESDACWEQLVLPPAQEEVLRQIVAHVRQRATVYERWGFSSRGTRGMGITALFAGASGTGKTLAAEVLAHELRLDLYRIDLSSMVSKYIGETEKNLRRVFDAAEEGGAILLFDEADALFGKRSEVKDSHDRYANIEVSYLLQRMEAYRGLAILTTNLKSALDSAFLRRIRFIINFPFPDAMQRYEIWRRIFPEALPQEGLDLHKLAKLNVAGGNIRNIALNAAFLAADAGQPVRMLHMLQAARGEYTKLEKPLTEVEIGGWV